MLCVGFKDFFKPNAIRSIVINRCFVLFVQPALLEALHMAVLQGKGSEVSKVLQGPLNYLDQSLSKGNMPYLTGVQYQNLLFSCCILYFPVPI